MEILLKKYFWVVNLTVVGLCAGFAGRAAGHFIEGAYLVGDTSAAPVRRGPPPPPLKLHGKDGEAVINRNIFCSGCAPIKPAPTSGTGQPVSNEWVKTSLQLELVSTMIVPTEEIWSMAIIRDMSTKEKDPAMYNKGATIGTTGAKVVKVDAKRVYLNNAGRWEYVEMEGAPAAAPAMASPQPQMAMAPGFDASQGDIDKGVTCNGNSCTVERQLVERLLANTTMLATAARFVPSMKDGKANGFKLYAIRPNSIFGKLQFQNGDTITAINGSDMSTPDAALALYTKLRNASHLSAQVERRGEKVTLDYTIR
jgi:general secretion pathway protein C